MGGRLVVGSVSDQGREHIALERKQVITAFLQPTPKAPTTTPQKTCPFFSAEHPSAPPILPAGFVMTILPVSVRLYFVTRAPAAVTRRTP